MLKHVPLKPNLIVLDIGSGAGFPLIELAQRLGTSSKCYGIDPWINANGRARQKLKNYEVKNVEIIESSAETLSFADGTVDLIVSNLGINNFDNPAIVFNECHRVLKQGGRLAITTNLKGHWQEFYNIFERTLIQLKMNDLLEKLNAHVEHRGSVKTISTLFGNAGLKVDRHFEENFEMRFLDGSALLNHSFVKLGWLGSWKGMIPEADQKTFFGKLEENLNSCAADNGGLTLTVPMAYIEGVKP